MDKPILFRPTDYDETNLRPHETVFRLCEGGPKPAPCIDWLTKRRAAKAHRQGHVMIKALSAIAFAAFIAAALSILPGFAPQVEASVPQALAKGDRLDIRPVGRGCSQQAWPNFEASCLRVSGSRTVIREARLVTADRTP